jgi:hypothetical protein
MHPDKSTLWLRLAAICGCILGLGVLPAAAATTIKYCATGTMTLGPFPEHIAEIRKFKRYDKDEIDKLIADEKAGGPEFFTSQIVVKEEQSGSGDYDLHLFQGYMDPDAKYHVRLKWACHRDDYPVAYLVGFRVRQISGGTIYVTRQKDNVNIISLKKLDPNLDKPTKVEDFRSHAVLCDDIARGCVTSIFYGRY